MAVQPQEIYEAVVETREAASCEPSRDAWMTTLAELFFNVLDTVELMLSLCGRGGETISYIYSDEKVVLYQFFEEACAKNDASYEKWVDYAKKATQTLFVQHRLVLQANLCKI